MYQGLDWEVQKYGHIIRTCDLDISVHRITTKVYIYKDKYYVETWINDIRYLFQPLDQKGSKNMKKIEIDAKLVTGLLAVTVTVDFRLSDNPFISFIKADSALETLHALEIISDEELEQYQKMLDVNYTCFKKKKKVKAKQELNKEGDTN